MDSWRTLANGQKLRVLTGVHVYTRDCLALEAAARFGGQDVATILGRGARTRGLPQTIPMDNGTEFTSRAFDQWAYTNQVQLDLSRLGLADGQRDDRVVQRQSAA